MKGNQPRSWRLSRADCEQLGHLSPLWRGVNFFFFTVIKIKIEIPINRIYISPSMWK